MNITSVSSLEPLIRFKFDRYLLLSAVERLNMEKKKIVILSEKKIRSCDVGKRRDFELFLKEFEELYVRKEIEKAEYTAECKKKEPRKTPFSKCGRYLQI